MRGFHSQYRVARRIGSVSAVILWLVVAGNAYTVVMHGGRRVEIPSRFVVTPATLTYEVTEGIQITIAIAAIDIPATEKANHEEPGSLLARAVSSPAVASGPRVGIENVSHGTRRTITNRDLETLRHKRQESEQAYESRRKELGLPSLEESRKSAAAQLDLMTTELAQKRIVQEEAEGYWRGRATALRTEMAALDAEIGFIRSQLDEGPFGMPLVGSAGSFGSIGSIIGLGFRGSANLGSRSFGSFGSGRSFRGQLMRRPNVYVAPTYGPQIRARVGLGRGAVLGQVFVNPGTNHRREIGAHTYFGILPNATVLGSPVQGYDFTYARSELITRFNQLAATRAGLNARWRALEDEARRAGVSPGWLRP